LTVPIAEDASSRCIRSVVNSHSTRRRRTKKVGSGVARSRCREQWDHRPASARREIRYKPGGFLRIRIEWRKNWVVRFRRCLEPSIPPKPSGGSVGENELETQGKVAQSKVVVQGQLSGAAAGTTRHESPEAEQLNAVESKINSIHDREPPNSIPPTTSQAPRHNEQGMTSKLHEEVTRNPTLLFVSTLTPTYRLQHSLCHLRPFVHHLPLPSPL